ncbi:MAG: hypothetical protein QGH06_04110, partial [Lutibacter sp.]|nr:hypothetical protein [Lutibacter sp.]
MRKRVFLFIVILMSIALIGIISVQVFWIQQTVQIKEAQFTENVRFSLAKVAEDIKLREFEEFYLDISEKYKDQGKKYAYADVRKYVFEKIDTASNERFTYSQSIVEANYKVPLAFTDTDSVGFKEIFGMEEFVRTKEPLVDNFGDLEPVAEKKLLRLGRFEEAEKSYLEKIFDVYTAEVPIHKRVSNREINLRLANELALRGIQTPFKYGIYNNGLATRVKSGYFTKETGKSYKVNMFPDAEGMSDYQLYVTFPEKETFIIA